MPRPVHREQPGFSFGHLTLDVAQASQLSRNLDVAYSVGLDECAPCSGSEVGMDWTA
jgi:hypothetical protein